MKDGLLLDVVIEKSAAVLELLASEDQALLVRCDTFLVLDLVLDPKETKREKRKPGPAFTFFFVTPPRNFLYNTMYQQIQQVVSDAYNSLPFNLRPSRSAT